MTDVKKNNNVKKNIKKKASPVTVGPTGGVGDFEYKMPRECANDVLRDRKGPDAKMNAQDYLCAYVNDQYGLIGNCVKVIIG